MSLHFKKHFHAVIQTPFLWISDEIYGINICNIPTQNYTTSSLTEPINKRLGFYVESLVKEQFLQHKNTSILVENMQISKDKITLGEIDLIIKRNDLIVHIEICYKFYLYLEDSNSNELHHWIGPNKKDSLLKKLTPLKTKQFPLIEKTETKQFLNSLNLDAQKMQQEAYFKAQLFVPYQNNKKFTKINSECIIGFYITVNQLAIFNDCKFYIPQKLNWLLNPHTQVPWSPFISFKEQIDPILKRDFSPLCWLKRPNGVLEKFFLVWW